MFLFKKTSATSFMRAIVSLAFVSPIALTIENTGAAAQGSQEECLGIAESAKRDLAAYETLVKGYRIYLSRYDALVAEFRTKSDRFEELGCSENLLIPGVRDVSGPACTAMLGELSDLHFQLATVALSFDESAQNRFVNIRARVEDDLARLERLECWSYLDDDKVPATGYSATVAQNDRLTPFSTRTITISKSAKAVVYHWDEGERCNVTFEYTLDDLPAYLQAEAQYAIVLEAKEPKGQCASAGGFWNKAKLEFQGFDIKEGPSGNAAVAYVPRTGDTKAGPRIFETEVFLIEPSPGAKSASIRFLVNHGGGFVEVATHSWKR